jgi:hypothetical protein
MKKIEKSKSVGNAILRKKIEIKLEKKGVVYSNTKQCPKSKRLEI